MVWLDWGLLLLFFGITYLFCISLMLSLRTVSIPRIIEGLELLLSQNVWTDFFFLSSRLVALLLSLRRSLIGGVMIIGQSNFLLLGLVFQSILLLSSS